MGLLDWFRPTWKHSRPDIRRAAVAAMGADDAHLLAQLARQDADPSVRRAAIAKVDDAETLAACAGDDADDKVRALAADRLDQLRLREALTAHDETRARLAIGRLGSAARLVEVAMKAESAITRRTALERIGDQAALLDIVRSSSDAQLRIAALDRVSEPRLLKDLALHDATREIQLRAVEKLEDLPSLEVVAQRAQIKAVRAAAAERVRARKPAAPPRAAKDEAEREAEEKRARSLAEAEARKRAAVESERREREQAQQRLRQAARPVAEPPAAVVDPVAEARRREERARRDEERARREEERVRREAEREAEKVRRETERAERERARAAEEARWVEAAAPLGSRLDALATSEDRRALDEALKALRDLPPLRGRMAAETEAVHKRFEEARGRAIARLAELRDAETWRRWANLPKFEALITRAEALLADEAADARARAQGLRALQAEWKALGAAPREKADALWTRFKTAGDKIHELAQAGLAVLDEERASNLEKKKELVARAEASADSVEWKATAELYKQLQEEWKAIGPVPKAEADAIWQRFRTACDRFFERRKELFAQSDAERAANLEKQLRLCEAAEALALSTDFRTTADKLKALQAEWKEIGMAGRTRAEADQAWQRFRTACDRFFERRKEAYAAEDEQRLTNLAAKEALCARAEALAAGDEIADPDEVIHGLVGEWKAAGPVPREHADRLWQRFNVACDKIRAPEPQAAVPDNEGADHQFENRPLEGLAGKLQS